MASIDNADERKRKRELFSGTAMDVAIMKRLKSKTDEERSKNDRLVNQVKETQKRSADVEESRKNLSNKTDQDSPLFEKGADGLRKKSLNESLIDTVKEIRRKKY